MPGETFASRAATAIVLAANISESVARNFNDYVDLGLESAKTNVLKRLSTRTKHGQTSQLFDVRLWVKRFEAGLEQAYVASGKHVIVMP